MAVRRTVAGLATIRARTTVAACVVVATALVVTAILFVIVLRRTLEGNLNDTGMARAEELATLVRETKLPLVLPDSGEKGAVIQVVDDGGRIIAASSQIVAGKRISALRPALGRSQAQTLDLLPMSGDQSGDRFRLLALGAQGPNGPVTVFVGISLDQVEESILAVRSILLVMLPVLLGIVGCTSWYVVGRALRPVDSIRQQVADIGGGELGRRVPEPPADDEIGRLARGMNLMLDRLQSFNERQRRFVADASHELQSPLASSLADLEVALAHPQSTDWPEIASGLVTDNQRMTGLVTDLLFLATSDDGASAPVRRSVDLDDVVIAEVARVRQRADVEIDVTGVRPVEIRANKGQLAQVVRNVLDNAVRYASSNVLVQLTADTTRAVLVVADDGPGIPPEAHERIFERFARLDHSRSRGTGGSGLGLAIARQIIVSHGGTIVAEQTSDGARFVVVLPFLGDG